MKAVDPGAPEGNVLFSTQKVFKCTSLPFQLDNNFIRNKKVWKFIQICESDFHITLIYLGTFQNKKLYFQP